jgi:hypothetical protein
MWGKSISNMHVQHAAHAYAAFDAAALLTQHQVDLVDEQYDLPSRIRHLLQQRLRAADDVSTSL